MKDIFFLKWKDHTLYLSEHEDKNFIDALEEEDIRVCYGSGLNEEDNSFIKTEMKAGIETAVNNWINDSRFIIHLLMAAGVFLVSFYFLSYVIRDPLPMVDEIVLSLLLAALAWYRLKNQEYQSEKVIHKKVELEQELSSITMEQMEYLKQIELYLEKLADMNGGELKKLLDSGAVPVFFTSEKKNLLKFVKSVDKYRKKTRFSKNRKFPGELNELSKQIRSFMKYHSSMV
ncbi:MULTISPECIES: hypothetical protein [unclassified Oceanispirochaeta]|uniref:hypothetical protein n=1 Tax=unclassified Oceanispirochaeta TaxID=2635722 RepID=UPI000E0948BA|nr:MULTISPECIES: hypothetical protein [unclassified Oceanispirochaeta]MBF9017677.1 hypothetical protein [Oceanispirochaeta sp. M2]NPD74249.1 hypothetical protein [Oceanispirochaeta sp. M1]RDG29955.1 hypothetical protein DV872_19300 [Oceanispirochaeta sp. M1]